MQYEVSSPEEYIAVLEDDWRKEKLLAIRAIVTAKAPELQEAVNYKMLGYTDGQQFVLHLNAQKGYVSLYVGNITKVDPDGQLLRNVKMGKGCVRFKKSVPVKDTGVEEFLERFFELYRGGTELGC